MAVAPGNYRSWGGTVAGAQRIFRPRTLGAARDALVESSAGPVIPFGCGRSYGDVALNPGGALIDCRGLDRFIAFDRETGVLSCEAGVRLGDILAALCRPDDRLYPAKDAVRADSFWQGYPRAGEFERHIDPAFSSGFARRVGLDRRVAAAT